MSSLIPALISAFLVGGLNLWINKRNRNFSARKDYMTRGLFLVNQAVSLVLHPKEGNNLSLVLDEIRTIFSLYGTKREREIERDISKALQHPYASTQMRSKSIDEIYELVALLTVEIRSDLNGRMGIW